MKIGLKAPSWIVEALNLDAVLMLPMSIALRCEPFLKVFELVTLHC